MKNEQVNEFIETITISEGEIRYHGVAYFIDGPIMFEPPMFSFRIDHMVFSEEENCHCKGIYHHEPMKNRLTE